MADKKLNEVPVVDDIVTIFGKRSNGEIVQIDKSNLAKVVGELMSIDKCLKPLDISSYTDMNDIVNTGIYGINIGIHPLENTPAGYGIGLTINPYQSAGGMYPCAQFMVRVNSVLYIRFRNSNVWTPWLEIATK